MSKKSPIWQIKHKNILFDSSELQGLTEYIPPADSFENKIKELLSAQLKFWLDDIHKKFKKKIDLYFFINNDSSINAGVGKKESEYYLYLNLGLLRNIKDFTNFVFLNHTTENKLNLLDAKYKDNYIDFFEGEITPKYRLANEICINILHSVFFHELGHLFLGHVKNEQSFSEVHLIANESCIDKQGFEYIADSFGTQQALWISINSLIYAKYPRDIDLYVKATTKFLISQYCLCTLFNIQKQGTNTSANQFQYDELLKYSHPHPAVRFVYILDIVQDSWINWLENIIGYTFEQATQAAREIIDLSLESYFEIIDQYSESELSNLRNSTRKKAVLEVVFEIKTRAAALHKEAIKYAMAPILDIVPPTEAYILSLLELANG